MKEIYCFDFDGTLTYKDTMFLFLKYYNPKRYYIELLKHLPFFVLLILKLAKADKVKQRFIYSVIQNDTKDNLEKKAQDFFEKYSKQIIRKKALNFIQKKQEEKSEMYLVSASLDIWLDPFAKYFGMTLVATKTEFINNRFTGRFIGENCNGSEKVKRLEKMLKDIKQRRVIAFGDTKADKPMLEWADEGNYKYFCD